MDFKIERQPMISGQDEATSRKYNLYVGKSGSRWLVAHQENSADNIYAEGSSNDRPKGFGGATLRFELVDGSTISLTGPWHSSSGALFRDTGVDVRDKHLTFGVIAKGRRYDTGDLNGTLTDVIYQDEEPTVGEFDRIDKMAKRMANELGEAIYAYSQSRGGSSCGPVYPDNKEE